MDDGSYAPAHALPDGRLERAGRVSKAKAVAKGVQPPSGSTNGEPAVSVSGGNGGGAAAQAVQGGRDDEASVLNSGYFARTAAILAIGDELLSGKVEDTNTPFLCSELHDMGWQVIL